MRSPNYGRRTRPARRRILYVMNVEVAADLVTVTLVGPSQPPITLQARDVGSALTRIELLRQGAWSLPVNPL
jgi:hypothetical protein